MRRTRAGLTESALSREVAEPKPSASTLAREATAQEQAEERERDRIRREQQTPAPVEPDADFWADEDEWELLDAALLLTNLEPYCELGERIKTIDNNVIESLRELSDDARERWAKVSKILRQARTAHRKGHLSIENNGTVEPRAFLIWARARGHRLPPALEPLVTAPDEQPTTTEKATRASAQKRRSRNVERDRRIHEAAAAGEQPKQIAGRETLSASRVREVLRRPKP